MDAAEAVSAPRISGFVPAVCQVETCGRCENQPDAVFDSTQDRLSATPASTPQSPGTTNDEIQSESSQLQASEDTRAEDQSVTADNGPDDHYHN